MKQATLVLAAIVAPSLAAAQAPPTPATAPAPAASPSPATLMGSAAPASGAPAATASPAPRPERGIGDEPALRIGGELAVLPLGSLAAGTRQQRMSINADAAFGIGGVLQRPLNQWFTVAFAPRLLFNVKGSSASASGTGTSSATELDLRGRLTAGGYASPVIRTYVALDPGYSVVLQPSDSPTPSNPSGPTLGFAVGLAFQVAGSAWMTSEIGYQFGFQSLLISGTEVALRSSFLHLAVGVLVDL
jgi:hypothetical protein